MLFYKYSEELEKLANQFLYSGYSVNIDKENAFLVANKHNEKYSVLIGDQSSKRLTYFNLFSVKNNCVKSYILEAGSLKEIIKT